MKRKIFISTSNDISTDNRVNKVAVLLEDLGYEVEWIGREMKDSVALHRSYRARRMKLCNSKGGLFYAEFQIRLFFKLLFRCNRKSILLSNDLDTLLPNFLISRFFEFHWSTIPTNIFVVFLKFKVDGYSVFGVQLKVLYFLG